MNKHVNSPDYAQTNPVLSVLIPFFRDDASELILALAKQETMDTSVEVILVDDGTGDALLTRKLEALIIGSEKAIKLITLGENQGRAAARNHLQEAARAPWILFLDADMMPTSPVFLLNYLKEIDKAQSDVIFGGFTVEKTPKDKHALKAGELHRALSEVSDCLPLAARIAGGPQYVASSNLCLKKSVIIAHPFDKNFIGWGWEDSEWAARISKHYRLTHIDNPALHLGLESTDTLLNRFKNSGPNYALFTRKHPDIAKTLKLYRLSKTLKSVPGQQIFRPILKLIVKSPAPLKARLMALKIWRASWYAEAL